ncbi:plasmid mobilization relaxosome protein MobC [Streptococcus iniae]|uniref:Plasmid mobilization relaxosome protein MobC n=1 Tax=Streptococcus iniae TaxID=1346 RepID=A0A1S1XV86_STRIN|nr:MULTISPECIES: plasmid mobilization relaxosome protein MobC [Streptococcus]KHD44159.1 mobilization protein [Streptococcus uberis]ESR10621.1 mobilization protein [Streptococcus iniae IUSA1]KYJ82810.1 mobilization protein [Streptococcus iniae]OHX27571.1 mobilization protein [Streptococcus iniae]RLU58506.1 plasmid mobilization relaxosome protein MobC [Streptococcus iniae]
MPQKTANRKRPIRKEVYFTEQEYRQVQHVMEQMQVPTFQYYAKNQLVQGKLVQIDFSELKNLRVAVNRIGGNINQIAKHANENQNISTEQLTQVLDYLSEIKDMVAVKLSSAEKKSLQERKTKEIRTYDEW